MAGDYTAEKRLYLTEDGKVTDDPETARWLLAAAGDTIPAARAEELGLTKPEVPSSAKADEKPQKKTKKGSTSQTTSTATADDVSES